MVIENRTAVAVKPRPELAPFFESLACQPDPQIASERKRRGSVALERCGEGYIIIAAALEVPRMGRSRRAALAEHRTSIDMATRERIRQLDDEGRSLRHIARDVGVSHESVRVVLRRLVVPSQDKGGSGPEED